MTLPQPTGDLWGLAWPGDERLIANYLEGGNGSANEGQLWQFRSNGSGFARIDLPTDHSCHQLGYLRPTALSDRRVGTIRECSRLSDTGALTMDAALLAIDPETGASETLAQVVQKSGVTGVSSFAWDIASRRGLISIGSGICQGIQLIDSGGLRPIDLNVADGGHQFNLADEFTQTGSDCSATGRASLPAITKDGSQVAFVASPRSVGLEGADRLDAPSSIFVADAALTKATGVLSDVTDIGAIAWSPNGKRLAFSGTVGNSGRGLWLLDTVSRTTTLVSHVQLSEIAWSPDGSQIAGLDSPTGTPVRKVLVFTVP